MITVDIVGGLGNQLFKIFAVIAYSIKHQQQFLFEYKEQILNRYTYWNSFLSRLKIFTTIIPINQTNYYNALRQNNVVLHKESAVYEYQEIPHYDGNSVFLRGYFQSYKYFEEYKEKIYQIIGLHNFQQQIKHTYTEYFSDENTSYISMHFRLGDYKKFPNHHPIIPIQYYEKALIEIHEKLQQESYCVLYFCEQEDNDYVLNSINSLKQNQLLHNFTFIKVDDTIDDWKQVILMSICNHNVIANSTFSWWGAYFGNQENRIVLYPSLWFGSVLNHLHTEQLFPPHWQKIDCV